MTRYEAYIGKDWKKLGMANVLVARIRPEKGVEFAVFLVDIFCLGVKDAMHEEGLSDDEFRRYLNERVGEHIREAIHPACAKKLIEGAIAYAENLGFSPHRDYRKARKVLSGLDAASCPETFLYGSSACPAMSAGRTIRKTGLIVCSPCLNESGVPMGSNLSIPTRRRTTWRMKRVMT